MKVFISWSGDYSRQIAAAIYWWLPKVLSVEDVYFSDIDIGVGSRRPKYTSTPSPMYFATNPPKRWTVSATHF